MRRFGGKVCQDSKGFTLVELLVVIGIMAALAAVVLLNVTGVIGSGEEEAQATELVTVQTAMDVMMAKNSLSSVNVTSSTKRYVSLSYWIPIVSELSADGNDISELLL